jgi:hypothetical protein
MHITLDVSRLILWNLLYFGIHNFMFFLCIFGNSYLSSGGGGYWNESDGKSAQENGTRWWNNWSIYGVTYEIIDESFGDLLYDGEML